MEEERVQALEEGRMQPDGARPGQQKKRCSRVAVAGLLQVQVVACLLLSVYILTTMMDDSRERETPPENVHIQFVALADLLGNITMHFTIQSNNSMYLDDTSEKIQVMCTGPYVLYMDVCYRSLNNRMSKGLLQLQLAGSKVPLTSDSLNTSVEVCRGLNSLAYLRAGEAVSLHLIDMGEFKIKNITVGLSYLLGMDCKF